MIETTRQNLALICIFVTQCGLKNTKAEQQRHGKHYRQF
jgi:hypothetical protein